MCVARDYQYLDTRGLFARLGYPGWAGPLLARLGLGGRKTWGCMRMPYRRMVDGSRYSVEKKKRASIRVYITPAWHTRGHRERPGGSRAHQRLAPPATAGLAARNVHSRCVACVLESTGTRWQESSHGVRFGGKEAARRRASPLLAKAKSSRRIGARDVEVGILKRQSSTSRLTGGAGAPLVSWTPSEDAFRDAPKGATKASCTED